MKFGSAWAMMVIAVVFLTALVVARVAHVPPVQALAASIFGWSMALLVWSATDDTPARRWTGAGFLLAALVALAALLA